jgi:hypothetical protein
MATGQIFSNEGLKLMLNRAFKETPDYTAPTRFKVGTGTTTPAIAQTDLVADVTIDADEWKDLATGYPSIDETNLQVTIRGIILSTEANGNSLTEFGVFNSDVSPIMISRTVHTAISKTTSVQIAYVEKEKL